MANFTPVARYLAVPLISLIITQDHAKKFLMADLAMNPIHMTSF